MVDENKKLLEEVSKLRSESPVNRVKTTLQTSGKDVKPHSKRVEKLWLFEVGYEDENVLRESSECVYAQQSPKFGSKTYSRIGLLRSYGNWQSYWTTTKLWKLTVVLEYYSRIYFILDALKQLSKSGSSEYLYSLRCKTDTLVSSVVSLSFRV